MAYINKKTAQISTRRREAEKRRYRLERNRGDFLFADRMVALDDPLLPLPVLSAIVIGVGSKLVFFAYLVACEAPVRTSGRYPGDGPG
jgi:hypothetical protein